MNFKVWLNRLLHFKWACPTVAAAKTTPLLPACLLFFFEPRVFDAWSLGVETQLQDGTAEPLFLARLVDMLLGQDLYLLSMQFYTGQVHCSRSESATKPNRGVSNALALPWATPWLQPVVWTLFEAPNKTHGYLENDRSVNAFGIGVECWSLGRLPARCFPRWHWIDKTKPRRVQRSSTPLGNALVAARCPNELWSTK